MKRPSRDLADPRLAWPEQERPFQTASRRTTIDRRDRAFWQGGKPKPSIVRRDAYFVIALDTGNS